MTIPYRLKDKWGFCNENKEIIIPCIYEYVNPFQEGLAPVKLNGLWGAISYSGEIKIPIISGSDYYKCDQWDGLINCLNSIYGNNTK